ncbi:MAG TPA: ABC transporter ATP-binding protein/permease [Candidatus Borkfalkia faecigallinarum]|uniref:ABC transporter ATP-binding protein/permease n=1 Tax=Candidatus Borkfalkia faecigallinarum TaxID=2838509 RepID=A0A9D1VTK9_9FIRM|nr:ABC transporter ATP-binding protein/permease [Candidatus Borkfalkia faecigallinarum]
MIGILKALKWREWVYAALSVACIVLQVWLDLTMPDYMSSITQLAVSGAGGNMGAIWRDGGLMLACALGSALSSVAVGFFAAQIAAALSFRLRAQVFDRVESFSMQEINRFSTASLITRTTNDITQVQMVVSMGLQVVIKAPILAVWAVIKITSTNWQWSAVTAAAVVLMVALMLFILLAVFPKFRKVQKLTDNLNAVTRENLTGVRVVRAYNAEEYQEEKFAKANLELTKTQLFTSRAMAVLAPVMTMLMSGLTLAIYWIGASLIDALPTGAERAALFGQMAAFSGYAMQVVAAFMMLAIIFIILPRAMVSVRRIREVLDTRPAIADGAISSLPADAPTGTVEFRHVSFRYPDASDDVLHDVSFRAERGQTVALIGSTGSGKSTVVNLIPRFYDATEGEVLVDGVNVKDFTLAALHDRIGYVPQRAVMFSGTVESNVAYGEKEGLAFTEEKVKEAVRIAQGQDFVEGKEDGYRAFVSQGGTNFSGGQKQRLSIARAVCREPEIFIFDDSFSALDYKTDKLLRQALKRELSGATSVIVAQRIGTIRDADLILVLEEGRVVGQGTHEELMESCEVYREIAYSQLTEAELNGQKGGDRT